MEIRPASPADLDAIAGLYLHNHLSTYRELLPDVQKAFRHSALKRLWKKHQK